MMTDDKSVQVTIAYETVVNDLPDAWAFIMSKIESVGPNPSVHIPPATNAPPAMLTQMFGPMDESLIVRKFHILVEGSTMQKREESVTDVSDLPSQGA